MKLNIELQPKQLRLLKLVKSDEYSIIGYGGSNGGGKSEAVRDVNLIMCLGEKIAPLRTLIFRRKSNDLLENHILPFFLRYPELAKYFNKTERMIYWPDGSTTKFGYAENETDIYDFEGKEYDLEFVDEATHCSQMMIEFLRTRNRGTGLTKAKMILTMIPGFVGHNYIKRLFIKKEYLPYEKPQDYYYLPARVWDNAVWSEKELAQQGFTVSQYYKEWTEKQRMDFTLQYSDYAQKLEHLPEQKRKARLFGDWDVFEGQFFEDWNPDVHIIKAEDYLTYDELKNFSIVGGLDYGNTTVLSCVARDFNGNFILFDELHLENLSRSEKIERQVEFQKERNLSGMLVVADTNMWIKDAFDVNVSNVPAYEYLAAGLKLITVSKISKDQRGYRIICNETVRNLLHFEMVNGKLTKPPKMMVYERCKHFIGTFPILITDKVKVEDIADGQDDHDYDAFKYAVMRLGVPIDKKAEEEKKKAAARLIPYPAMTKTNRLEVTDRQLVF